MLRISIGKWLFIMRLLCIINFWQPLFAQQLTYSEPFFSTGLYPEYTILGQQGNRFIVLSSPITADPVLMVFNDSLQLIHQNSVNIFRGSSILAVKRSATSVRVLSEYPQPGRNSYRSAVLNSSGNIASVNEIIALNTDTSSTWSFIKSPDQLFHLLYRVNRPANDSISIDFVVLDSNYAVHVSGSADMPFSTEFDRLNPVYIDDEGRLWITIFDQPLNYKLGADIRLYCYLKGEEKLQFRKFYTKEKKPVEFIYKFSKKSNTTTLHSLYIDFFSRDIAGYLSVSFSNNILPDGEPAIAVYEFETDLKKDMQRLTSGITRDNLMNYLKIHSVNNMDDSSFLVISALNYSEYKTNAPPQGVVATRSASLTEQNPLRTAYQRDALVRQLSGTDRRSVRARRRDGLPANSSTSSSAGAEAMRLRPDLFFFPDNNNPQGNPFQSVPSTSKKIFDKYLFWSFRNPLEPGWQQWIKKEYWPARQLNNAYIDENSNQVVIFFYQHNKKEKTELVIEILDKKTGIINEYILPLDENAYPLFSLPALKVKDNDYIFICTLNNDPAQSGICRLTW